MRQLRGRLVNEAINPNYIYGDKDFDVCDNCARAIQKVIRDLKYKSKEA